jgi:hypothetical protein
MKWIDVRDRMPEDDTCVIVASADAGEALVVAWYDDEDETWNDMHGVVVTSIEFWMPLPPLPGAELADN